jgi:hypothetical protein
MYMEKYDELGATPRRHPWERPTLKAVGTVSQLVQAGTGKMSANPFDTGDPPFKPPGQH